MEFFTLFQGRPYLSEQYLYQKGVSQDKLNSLAKKFREGISNLCGYYQENRQKWFLYFLLPRRWISLYSLPQSIEEIHCLIEQQNEDNKCFAENHISFILNNAWVDPVRWKQFIPFYRDYFFDNDILIKFAKSHALFDEIISLSNGFPLSFIHPIYQQFVEAVFQTTNKNSFMNKIKDAKINGIEHSLIHEFTQNQRTPYKVDGLLLSRIKYFYCNEKTASYKNILKHVNDERFDRGLSGISLSTLKRVLLNRELRNECDPIRYGKAFGEKYIYPYLNRKNPEFCELIEIDSTRLNIPYKNEEDELSFMFLCVAMEIHTRKILGYSLSTSEGQQMILSSLKMALNNLEYKPRQILHDNHKAYFSSQFKKFSKAAFEAGIDFRSSKIGNARDKAHIERWFGTFQTEFLNTAFGSLGDGIKSSRVGGRVSKEVENLSKKKKYLRDESELKKLVKVLIAKYNSSPRKNNKSPNEMYIDANKNDLKKLTRPDLIKMFYSSKYRRVQNEQIEFTYESKTYSYKIENEVVAKRINGTEVKIMFDEEDLNIVSIFDKKTGKYVCDLKLEERINIIPSKKDWSKISKHHWSLKKRIEQNLKELNDEIEQGREELHSIPVVALNPISQLEEVLNYAEDQWFKDKIYNRSKTGTSRIKQKKKGKNASKDRSPLSSKFNQKGSLKKFK